MSNSMSRVRTIKSHPNEKPSELRKVEKAVKQYLENINTNQKVIAPKRHAAKK